MHRFRLVCAALILIAPLPCDAQERLARRINVDAHDEDLRGLLAQISEATGVPVLVEAHVAERVTIRLHDVRWRDAVAVIAQRAGCRIEPLPGGGLLLRQPPQITIQLQDASVRTALLLLSRYAGTSIVIAPDVTGTISLDLRDVDWDRALNAVVLAAGDYAVIRDRGLITVGGRGGERADDAAAPILAGRFVARQGDALLIRSEGGHDLRCALPRQADLRGRVLRVVDGLRPGARIVFSVAGEEGAWRLTNLVASSR